MQNQTFTKLYHKLGRKIGPLEALTLQFLADLQQNVFPGKPFFQQQDRIAETLGISIRQVQTYTKKLKTLNLITYNRGVGALYYYTVNLKAIDNILAEEEDLGTFESPLKGTSNNTNCDVEQYKMSPSNSTKCDVRTVQNVTFNSTKCDVIDYTNNYTKNKNKNNNKKLTKASSSTKSFLINNKKTKTMSIENLNQFDELNFEAQFYIDEIFKLYPNDVNDLNPTDFNNLPVETIKTAYESLSKFINIHVDNQKALPSLSIYFNRSLWEADKLDKLTTMFTPEPVKVSWLRSNSYLDIDEPEGIDF